MEQLPPFLPILFPVAIFLGVSALIAHFGWNKLKPSYEYSIGSLTGDVFRMQRISIGKVRYNNGVNIRICPQGLYLSVFFVLRFMHPPLLIPWRAITHVEEKNFLGFSYATLQIGSPKITTITLPDKILQKIYEKGYVPRISEKSPSEIF